MPIHDDLDCSIIGAICIDPICLSAIRETGLVVEDFTNGAAADTYETVCALADENKTIDPVILADALKETVTDSTKFIKDCMDVCPTAVNAPYHATLLHKKGKNRRLKDSVFSALSNQDGADLAGVLSGLSSNFLKDDAGTSIVPLSKACTTVYERLSKNKHKQRLNTGYQRLDGLLKGLWPGQLIIVGARPGVGKSAFAASVAVNAARSGTPVLFCSLEMTADEIAERMLSAESGIDMDTLIDGTDNTKVFGQLVPACSSLYRLPLTIHDKPGLTVAQLRARARAIKGLGLVVVDYLGLMASDRKRESRVLEIGDISRGLKLLAGELGVPIIALSQLNRGQDETEQPSLRSLRDSGEIEQDASKVILLWRINPQERVVGAYVAKNRRGATGVVQYKFDGAHMRFIESSESYQPQKAKRPSIYD